MSSNAKRASVAGVGLQLQQHRRSRWVLELLEVVAQPS